MLLYSAALPLYRWRAISVWDHWEQMPVPALEEPDAESPFYAAFQARDLLMLVDSGKLPEIFSSVETSGEPPGGRP